MMKKGRSQGYKHIDQRSRKSVVRFSVAQTGYRGSTGGTSPPPPVLPFTAEGNEGIVTIKPFSSIDEAFEDIRSELESADSRVSERQQATIGDCFIRVAMEEDLIIYGEVLDPAIPASDISRYNQEERDSVLAEIREDAKIYNEPHMKQMRWTRCFSVACEDGELGDTHCSTMHKFIKRGTFDQAKMRKWPSTPEGVCSLMKDCGESLEPDP